MTSRETHRFSLTEDCRRGDLEAVREWIRRDASLVKPTDYREPDEFLILLFGAAESGSEDCVRLLLDAGADVNEATRDGETALCHAATPSVARHLIASGAKVNAHDGYLDVLENVFERANDEADCGTPNAFAVADVLLEAGASLDYNFKQDWTRLYLAAFRHQALVVEYLLERGASRVVNDRGATPLHAICWQGEYQEEETNAACERIIRALVGAGFSTDARDSEGRTPLHKATGGDGGNPTAIKTLLSLGAEIDPVDGEGRTPLHLASTRHDLKVVEMLLKAGANPRIQDNRGFTPIDFATAEVDAWQRYADFDASIADPSTDLKLLYDLRRIAHDGKLHVVKSILECLQNF